MKRHRETVELPGARIEVERMGSGPPLVLLQSAEAYESGLDLVDRLAGSREVFLPWAPGYGGSPLPDDVRTVDDVAYIYLDLIERYDLRDIVLVGCSLGGWIAAEMATKTCERLSKLVLVDPVGAKFGGTYDRDIEDIYFLSFDKVNGDQVRRPAPRPAGRHDRARRGRGDAGRAAPRDHGAAVLGSLFPQPGAEEPAAPYRGSDAGSVGRGGPLRPAPTTAGPTRSGSPIPGLSASPGPAIIPISSSRTPSWARSRHSSTARPGSRGGNGMELYHFTRISLAAPAARPIPSPRCG